MARATRRGARGLRGAHRRDLNARTRGRSAHDRRSRSRCCDWNGRGRRLGGGHRGSSSGAVARGALRGRTLHCEKARVGLDAPREREREAAAREGSAAATQREVHAQVAHRVGHLAALAGRERHRRRAAQIALKHAPIAVVVGDVEHHVRARTAAHFEALMRGAIFGRADGRSHRHGRVRRERVRPREQPRPAVLRERREREERRRARERPGHRPRIPLHGFHFCSLARGDQTRIDEIPHHSP